MLSLPLFLLLSTSMELGADAGPYVEKKVTITSDKGSEETYSYRLLPVEKPEAGKKYPLVLFLHGAGERGSDNVNQLQYFPRHIAKPDLRAKFPAYVVAVQCSEGKQWVQVPWGDKKSTPMAEKPGEQMRQAIAALLKTVKEEPIDTRRIYVTGLSMGGYGAWEIASRHPEWFAAAAPICGGGDERQAAKLAGVAIWAFHGAKDGAVPVERTRQMVEAIKAAGGKPKYTEDPNGGHNVWDPAYQDPEGLLPWLFSQMREKEVATP